VEQYPGLHQTEGMTVNGKNIYFGIYPKAILYVYNTEKPWDLKAKNPRLIKKIEGQDRPFATLSLPESDKILFGTVPDYGKLGGTLVEYDLKTDSVTVFDNIINKQSVVSLVHAGSYVLAGTSISGGLGIQPSEPEAKLFGWDPEKRTILFESVPVPGAMGITGLTRTNDGNIWGMAEGTLFVFDPVKKEVISRKQVFPVTTRGTHLWRSAFLVAHPNGTVYMSVNNILYGIDPKTLDIKKLADGVALINMDSKGHIYFKRGTNLWRYEP
jgi:hypothetical protein